LPRGKDPIAKWVRFRAAHSQVLEYELFPLALIVKGDIGVAHYSVVMVREDEKGESKRSGSGSWKRCIAKDVTGSTSR